MIRKDHGQDYNLLLPNKENNNKRTTDLSNLNSGSAKAALQRCQKTETEKKTRAASLNIYQARGGVANTSHTATVALRGLIDFVNLYLALQQCF